MCPQRCLFFLKWRQNQSSWKIKSNLSFTAECYATALKCINQFIHAALPQMLDMFTGGEQTWNTFICSALFVVKTPVCDCDVRDVSSVDDRYKISWQWRQWFPGRSVSSVFHLPGRGGHEAVIFICSTTSSSLPHQPGLVQSNAELCCNLWPVILNCSTLVPHQNNHE